MSTHTATERLQSISTPDRLLRFDAMTDARYEREHGAARVAALRHLILMGLLFFNISIFTSAILTPDIFWLSFVLRTGIITPGSLVLAWAIGRMGGVGRERLVTGGLTAVIAAIAFLFRSSQAPQAGYMIGELPLFLVFGNMLLVLRFRHALVYTASTFVFVVAAIVTKPGLDQGLQGALLIQLTTGCLFSLYANHRSESARCRAYLDEVRARLETEAAEAASSRFLDLSMTDALTGLPNRRALDRTVG